MSEKKRDTRPTGAGQSTTGGESSGSGGQSYTATNHTGPAGGEPPDGDATARAAENRSARSGTGDRNTASGSDTEDLNS